MRNFIKEWWPIMCLLIVFSVLVYFALRALLEADRRADLTKEYRGVIIDKGYDPPSSGYKSTSEAKYWLVIMDDECHKAVRIHVTPACYYSLDKGQRASFDLSGMEMTSYGNTEKYQHLK